MKKRQRKILAFSATVLGTAFIGMNVVAKIKKGKSAYKNKPEQNNSMEGKKVILVEDENDKENADGVKGHLEAVGDSNHVPGFYEKYIKRGMDIVLSFGG